jgi:hypothetical protein
MQTYIRAAAIAAVITGGAASTQAAFVINLNFSGSTTPQQQAIFNDAKSTWESVISGYKPLVSLSGLTITASVEPIDNLGGTLGSAGPTFGASHAGSFYATAGVMTFDSADVSDLIATSRFDDVILHEMGHVLGIGTLWTYNNLYVNGSGQYTGVNGLAAYRSEFNQPDATYVPVELGGGSGTMNAHWNEIDGGGGTTGFASNITGLDLRDELMTGWIGGETFMSNLTRASMIDLGYAVNPMPVPEPASALLAAFSVTTLALRRRR